MATLWDRFSKGRLGLAYLDPHACDAARAGAAKVAFVHINKAGGTSIAQALAKCMLNASILLDNTLDGLHHHSVQDYAQFALRGGHALRDVFSFAVVRDPYARQVSLFQYNVEKCWRGRNSDSLWQGNSAECPNHQMLPWFQLQQVISNASANIADFHRWLHAMNRAFPEGTARSALFSGMQAGTTNRSDASQIGWLADSTSHISVSLLLRLDGPRPIDEVWRDMAATCLPSCRNTSLHHLKSSAHLPTAAYYAGEAGRAAAALIERRHARDFELLGYPRRPRTVAAR